MRKLIHEMEQFFSDSWFLLYWGPNWAYLQLPMSRTASSYSSSRASQGRNCDSESLSQPQLPTCSRKKLPMLCSMYYLPPLPAQLSLLPSWEVKVKISFTSSSCLQRTWGKKRKKEKHSKWKAVICHSLAYSKSMESMQRLNVSVRADKPRHQLDPLISAN